MCRSIKPLFNFDPPATEDEIQAAALQYVRKVSGFAKPSEVNHESFEAAVQEIAQVTHTLLASLETKAHPRSREVELMRARERNKSRFPTRS